MIIEINATCKYKNEFGGEYTEVMSGFINNRTINDFDFNKYTKQFHDELVERDLYDEVRIDSIEIKSWDLSRSVESNLKTINHK